MLTHTSNMKIVLTTSKDAVGRLLVTTESVLEMQPLDNAEVAKMLLKRAPSLRKNYSSRAQFMSSVEQHEVLSFLHGNPFRVGLLASLVQRLPPAKRHLDEAARLLKSRRANAEGGALGLEREDSESEQFVDKELVHLIDEIMNMEISEAEGEEEDVAAGRATQLTTEVVEMGSGLRRRSSTGRSSSRAGSRQNSSAPQPEPSVLFPPPSSPTSSSDGLLGGEVSGSGSMRFKSGGTKSNVNVNLQSATPLSSFAGSEVLNMVAAPPPMLGQQYFDKVLSGPIVLLVVVGVWYAKLVVGIVALDTGAQRAVFLSHLLVDISLVVALYYLYHATIAQRNSSLNV